MSTTDPVRAPQDAPDDPDYEYAPGEGWVIFAGFLLAILAGLNLIQGIAAVSNSAFFVNDAKFIFSNLNTWGWILTVAGVVQGLAAVGVMFQVKGVRWLGVAIAALNAIAQMLFISAYPLWSLAVFTLDLLVIYGLVVHGARSGRTL